MSRNSSVFDLHNSDVRELQTVLARYGYHKEFVDVTITSPPYHDIKSYGFKNQIGHGQKYSQYLDDLGRIFGELYHVTRDTGSLWIIVDTFTKQGKLVNLPWDISQKIMENEWELVDVIIWKKDKTLPWSTKGRLRNIFEYVLLFAKSKHYKFYADRVRIADFAELKEWWVKFPERYNPKGKLPTNLWEHVDSEGYHFNDIWMHAIPVQGSWSHRSMRHFNPLPPDMIERILLLTTDHNDVVLDPFAGSGTVLAVADFMKRRWLGFELNTDYCSMFRNHTLSEIRDEMIARKRRDNEVMELQRQFKKTIKSLRLVKFPKILVRELISRESMRDVDNTINTMFALSQQQDDLTALPKHKLWTEQIFLVFECSVERRRALHEKIAKIILTPPLSKFGIKPEVFIVDRKELASEYGKDFKKKKFWLYINGIVHKFEKSMNFTQWLGENRSSEWRNYTKDGIPPILSNIKVNQEVPKTWVSREEKVRVRAQILKAIYDRMIKMECLLEY